MGEVAPLIELTVVTPTYNERDNVRLLARRVEEALEGLRWQLIFVDDHSPDGTAAAVRQMAAEDRRIVCLQRVGRRGLAGAVIEGVMASAAPFVAVIDADLQHDERLLRPMLSLLKEGRADLVVGSRYLEGEAGGGLSRRRLAGSRLANLLARRALKVSLSDPMSGFFMIRRDLFDRVAARLSTRGFKILVDLIASQPTAPRIAELPYAFSRRRAGASKLDRRVVVDYLGLLLAKASRDLVSPRALAFFIVGFSGLAVNLLALKLLLPIGFSLAQALAAATAMTTNYLLNNAITYRDRSRVGWALFGGYLKFCALCAVGLGANVAVASLVERHLHLWWAAGAAGAGVGAVWNYLTTAVAVW